MKSFFDNMHISRQQYFILVTIAFFFILGYFFIAWPIVAYDTDLWYHLSGGRYFFKNHLIASNSFFSFLQPVKHWYNYYWLFQIITYTIFSHAGYYGLILSRWLLFTAAACFVFLLLMPKDEENDARTVLVAMIFSASVIALTHRELLIRPHLFTYLFITVFLYILEKKKELLYLLPVLGVLWCNIHGIEYPVMILIVFAYLAEFFQRGGKNTAVEGKGRYANLLLIMTCYTVFLTPGGLELLPVPFDSSYGEGRFQYLYIGELLRMSWRQFFSFSILPFSAIIPLLRNFLVILSLAAFLICIYKRDLRISHAILFLGAIVLLLKHGRFIYEFILLSIPMIREGVKSLPWPGARPVKRTVLYHIALPIVLIVVPLVTYADCFKLTPRYPFSSARLPVGNVAFLDYINVGGKVMNLPNNGGYLQWSLNKNYQIAMDLQMSLFNDEDFANVTLAFYDENAFRTFIKKYDPSFITVPRYLQSFKKVISGQTQFAPVFFDGHEILFVNQNHFTAIAGRFRLQAIDPFTILDADFEKMDGKQKSSICNEAKRILGIDKTNPVANWIVGNIMVINGNGREALTRADVVINAHPELAAGYALKADAMMALGRYREALPLYKMAVEREPEINKTVYRNLFVVYNKLQEYKKAYKLYSRIVNPFVGDTSYKDIYELAISASAAGKQKDAIVFLKIALLKLPPEDKEYAEKIRYMFSLMKK